MSDGRRATTFVHPDFTRTGSLSADILTPAVKQGGVLTGWSTDQRRRGLLPSTIRRRGDMVRAWVRWLEDRGLTLRGATEDDVQRFLDSKRTRVGRQISDRTRYTWLSALHIFYEWAIRNGHADQDPTSEIIRPKLRRTLPRPATDAELAYALAHLPRMIRVWVTLAAYSGLRCAEIASLYRDDVLTDVGKLRVVGKGQKERLVPIHPLVAKELADWPKPRTNGPLFTRPAGGAFPPALLSRTASVALHDIGVNVTMHQFRHWFGTRTLSKCKNLRVVQELMGHADPKITAIYTAFADDEQVDAVRALREPQPEQVTLWSAPRA